MICGGFCVGVAFLFLKVLAKHIAHGDRPPATKVVVDLVLSGVFAFCAYSLFTWDRRNGKRAPGQE
jgi:hypothetical protein